MEKPNTMYLEIDFEDKGGEWFPFQMSTVNDDFEPVFAPPQSDIENGPAVCVRQADSTFFEKLQKKTRQRKVDHVLNKKTRQMDRVVSFEPIDEAAAQEESDALWDYCIVGIRKFKDKNTGEELRGTKEDKVGLMKNQLFARFVNKCLKDLAASSGVVLKAETENL